MHPALHQVYAYVSLTRHENRRDHRPAQQYYWGANRADTTGRWRFARYWYLKWQNAVQQPSLLPAWVVWARSPGPACVSHLEGGLRSVNPAGPYYGKWQADAGFASTYNPRAWQRWGPPIYWPESEQDRMAWHGWQARGWSPWPATSAACGL